MRFAVIGAGNMGRHHARILSQIAELAYVIDPDLDRASALVEQYGGRALPDISETDFDAAVIATPTQAHLPVALQVFGMGKSALIEKPLAGSVADAQSIIAAAHGLTLAVGHVERYNPAVRLLSKMELQPSLVQFQRLSPYTPRIAGSVTFDLMVHDIDIASWLLGSEPSEIAAQGVKVFSDTPDAVSAVLRYGNCVVAMQASRITQDKVRQVSLSERERFIHADLLRRDIRVKCDASSNLDNALHQRAGVVEITDFAQSEEPLVLELKDFIDAVSEGRSPSVTGRDGLRAVGIAAEIDRLCGC